MKGLDPDVFDFEGFETPVSTRRQIQKENNPSGLINE